MSSLNPDNHHLPLRTLHKASCWILLLVSPARADERWAPNAVAGPVDQLLIAGNACGPAALLTSIRCGDKNWQAIAAKLPAKDDRSRLLYIIQAHGLRPSISLRDRKRWTRHGINAEDLNAIARELAALGPLPPPRPEDLFTKQRESPEGLLDRTHDHLCDSLKRGFPPVLSLRRYVFRAGQWTVLEGHFVSIVQVPEKLPRRSRSFPVTYFDPWGGRKESGHLRIPDSPVLGTGGSPCLIADFPKANVARSRVRPKEPTALIPAIALGRW